MGWTDIFKRKKKEEPDLISNLSLATIKPGYIVDYDLKSWEVKSYSHYDWGDGELTYEWQLKSSDDTIYLEREPDDEDFWSISRKISMVKLGHNIKSHIMKNNNPPDEIEFEGTTYYLEESGAGRFFENGKKGHAQEMISWDYEDDSGDKYLSIEQWDEDEFEASLGHKVEEYQFTNILPAGSQTKS